MLGEILGFVKDNVDDFLNLSPVRTKGQFFDHEIEVTLDAKKISLYIDNEIAESSPVYLWPKKDAVLVRGVIKDGNSKHVVHVYGRSSLFKTKLKICVDEKQIAGDEF